MENMKINWFTVNGQPVPTTSREKMAIISLAFFSAFAAMFTLMLVFLALLGGVLFLLSPALLLGWLIWLIV